MYLSTFNTELTGDLVLLYAICRAPNVLVQMVLWSQNAEGSRACAAHRHA